mmetsp:Transcript_63437/g.183827  ORF Transcript_63437/g.183827 Transcript_63437/m.183827 type:complete len:279 (-) Transcript_63437:84-920(-)
MLSSLLSLRLIPTPIMMMSSSWSSLSTCPVFVSFSLPAPMTLTTNVFLGVSTTISAGPSTFSTSFASSLPLSTTALPATSSSPSSPTASPLPTAKSSPSPATSATTVSLGVSTIISAGPSLSFVASPRSSAWSATALSVILLSPSLPATSSMFSSPTASLLSSSSAPKFAFGAAWSVATGGNTFGNPSDRGGFGACAAMLTAKPLRPLRPGASPNASFNAAGMWRPISANEPCAGPPGGLSSRRMYPTPRACTSAVDKARRAATHEAHDAGTGKTRMS